MDRLNCYRKNMLLAFLLCSFLCTMSGCGDKPEAKREDLTFTICNGTQLPDDLTKIIEEKKLHPFQISYTTKENLYIVVGYGEHDRTNLQVVVEELFKTNRAIYVRTNLETCEASATDAETTGEASMYPYIVIKCERLNLPVLYE